VQDRLDEPAGWVHVALPSALLALMLKSAGRSAGGPSNKLPPASYHLTSIRTRCMAFSVEVGVDVEVGGSTVAVSAEIGVSVGSDDSGVSVGGGGSGVSVGGTEVSVGGSGVGKGES
jgi:hypothetical protein